MALERQAVAKLKMPLRGRVGRSRRLHGIDMLVGVGFSRRVRESAFFRVCKTLSKTGNFRLTATDRIEHKSFVLIDDIEEHFG